MNADKLLIQVNDVLGDKGSLTLETSVRTSEGVRILAVWNREGYEGQKRAAFGWNLVEVFRKILLYEEEVTAANPIVPLPAPEDDGAFFVTEVGVDTPPNET
jgi:hypothetical protein